MLSRLSILVSTFAFGLVPASEPVDHGGHGGQGLLGGVVLGIDLGGDSDGHVDVAPGDCFGVDIEVGASCGVLAGVDALLECDPLSVEAACIAELGADCGLEAFAACTAALTAHCEAELQAGGALFCDGHFLGADTCLGSIDVDVDLDADACVDVDLGADLDLDLDASLCLDLGLGLNLGCKAELGAGCHAQCDPIAAEAYCDAHVDAGDGVHAYAACQAGVMAHCHAQCDADGALFCGGGTYVGADICLGIGLGIGIGL